MPQFQFTPPPWLPGPRNRRYGLTRGIYAGTGQNRIELGRMFIGSPEYEANFSLVLAAPDLLMACDGLIPTLVHLEAQRLYAHPQQIENVRQAILKATTITGGQP